MRVRWVVVAGVRRRCSARPTGSTRAVPPGVRARRGPGLLHHHRPGAGRARRSSTRRTSRSRPSRSCCKDPEIAGVFAVVGFSFSGAAPNQGHDVRAAEADSTSGKGDEHSLQAVVGRLSRPAARRSPARWSLPFPPPSIQGLGAFGGFQFEVLDQTRRPTSTRWRRRRYALIGAGQPDRRGWRALFTPFTANDPQLVRRRSIASRRRRSGCR